MSDTDFQARNDVQRLSTRLAEIERRLDAVTSMLDLPFELYSERRGGLSPAVQEAVSRGDVLEAIKQLRAETGMGLAEAKAVIENAQ
ncbi:MAG: hypothetical protein U0R70_01420 [Solirubrobacteraceae bacterium]